MKHDFNMAFEERSVPNSIKMDYSERQKMLRSALVITTTFPLKTKRIFLLACGITILQKGESWIKERFGRDFEAGT